MYPMVLLGDEAQVEAHFGLLGDCANLDARMVMRTSTLSIHPHLHHRKHRFVLLLVPVAISSTIR
jgi:hypothetical protein